MAKFVYVYTGGAMAETPEAQQESMNAWTAWFAGLDGAVVDIGNPFGEASTVTSAGSTPGAASGLGGYSIIEADSLDAAAAKAAGCPVIGSGGSVEIYDALPM
ncbi:YciI family protein [Microlunatus ginsengisoli]|uniref:YCII-related domain-containing protein n=1 Tax=Microlunatus ginsengisoli TaxID=363863 RepID=A0ABP6ZD01_9ACTN